MGSTPKIVMDRQILDAFLFHGTLDTGSDRRMVASKQGKKALPQAVFCFARQKAYHTANLCQESFAA